MKLNEAEMRMAYQIESTDPNAVLNEIYMTWRLSRNQAKVAIVRANRYVVDSVDYLIAYVWHPASNAWKLVEYAKRRKKKGGLFITLI